MTPMANIVVKVIPIAASCLILLLECISSIINVVKIPAIKAPINIGKSDLDPAIIYAIAIPGKTL